LSKAKPRRINVEIYDQKYSIYLTSPLTESEVRTLAEEVDSRMRDISAAANTADSLKVAVLTALHLAHELAEVRRKSDEWTHALEEVLKK
jgi:cell division protein ZapA